MNTDKLIIMDSVFVVLRRPIKDCPDDCCWFVTVCRDRDTADGMVLSFNNCSDLDFDAYFYLNIKFNYTLL